MPVIDPETVEENSQAVELAGLYATLLESMGGAVDDVSSTVRNMYRDAGIDAPQAAEQPTWDGYDFSADAAGRNRVRAAAVERTMMFDPSSSYEVAQEWAASFSGPSLVDRSFDLGAELVLNEFATVQAEIGYPGTRIINGVISVEHNPRLTPGLARGSYGTPGENEELYRVDPISHRFYNETSSLVCAASYDPHIPQRIGTDGELERVVNRAHRHIESATGRDWLVDNATFIRHGFAMSEKIWTSRGGWIGLARCPFREQAITYRHIFDDRMSEHLGTEFMTSMLTGYGGGQPFTLTRGMTPESARLLVTNINAVGNNVEGLTPFRVVTGLDKLRQLIMTLYAISYQRYGVPIAKVFVQIAEIASAFMSAQGSMPTANDLQKIATRLQNARGRKGGGVIMTTPGVDYEFVAPATDMPDPRPMLDYIDLLKSVAYGIEGILSGSQSFGSYAMSDVADRRYMRMAPVYAEAVARAKTELLHDHIRFNYPRAFALEEWPYYVARFRAPPDATAWIGDAIAIMAAKPWTWPKPMREQASSLLGLPSGTFDSEPAATAAIADRQGGM